MYELQRGSLVAFFLDGGDVWRSTRADARQERRRLFLLNFALLFFELVCIRWIPAYVRYIGYFTNFVLLAGFLGSGLGILLGRRPLLIPRFPILLLLLVCIAGFSGFELHIPSTEVLYFGASEAPARSENWLVLLVVFTMVVFAFMGLARPLGGLFARLAPLEAYALNILGSLAGAAAFFVISYFALPPWVWFSLLGSALLLLYPARDLAATLPPLLAALAVVFSLGRNSLWSPYYRVQVYPERPGGYMVNVNNISHQEVVSYLKKETFYFRAYDLLGDRPFKNVLVIGAGTGSDVAIALHNGAENVDAVEIDPVIYQLGRQLNPDRPYSDPRVHIHLEDGRAFLKNSPSRYDLIVFGMPDSLTLTSGFASLRLESFLLTTDSLANARERLTRDGVLVLYNYYRQDWLVDKLGGMLEAVFGRPPYVTTYGAGGRAAVLLDGPGLDRLDPFLAVLYEEGPALSANGTGRPLPVIGEGLLRTDPNQALATDDWPFPYLRVAAVPWIYVGGLATISAVALALLWMVRPPGLLRKFEWHFFCLGAAFMLLETRSLVTFALLFGSTWTVNSLVFMGMLLSVLLAIGLSPRLAPARVWPLYASLFALLLFNYFVPARTLLAVPAAPLRYLLASLLTFGPVFLANLVFSHSFRESPSADVAFASNLLGAMAGGGCEYLALAFGYQFLLVPIAVFYAGALFLRRR
jgi:spermidine synthase